MINEFYLKHIKKCEIIHNYKYDYSKVVYIKLKNKVEIICPIHGSFFCNLDNHLTKKTGCKLCNIPNRNKNYIFIPPENNYDYSKAIYVNSRTKIEIICKLHGSFYQTPNNILSKNHICPKCSLLNKSKNLLGDFEQYKIILNEFHFNKYDYSKFIYTGYKIKSIIICPKHGEFLQSVEVHINSGCSKCSESRGEKAVRLFLEKNNIKYEVQKKFDNCINKRKLPFDFYLNDFNTCIEFDGSHHYGISKNFTINFDEIKIKDKIKTDFCLNNNIKLIRIPYYDYNKIDSILNNI